MTQSAMNLEGILIRDIDGNYYFRVYEGGEFTDYKICHHDLKIKVLDDDAVIYKNNDENYIDYSPHTLGKD